MRGFAVALAVSLSAGLLAAQDPAPGAGQEDRVPIPAQIDSWYRVDQDKDPRGYFHEQLTTTTMRNYRYDYFVESEYEHTRKAANGDEEYIQISEHLTAQLEEDFDIFQMEYTLVVNGNRTIINLTTASETDERVVKYSLPGEKDTDPTKSREYKFLVTEPIHLYLNPMLYKLRQLGSLAQPTRAREKVLITNQDDPVSVSYYTEPMTSKEFFGKPTRFTAVKIEGWDRGDMAPLSKFSIDRYGRILEASTSDGSITFTLVKEAREAKKADRSTLSPKGRRDPFAKGGAMTAKGDLKDKPGGAAGPGGKTPKVQPITQEKFDATYAETQSLVQQLQDLVAKGLEEEALVVYRKIATNYKGLYPLAQGDIVKRTNVEKVREDAERTYPGVEKQLNTALAKLDRINDLYNADNLEGIEKEIKELMAMRDLPEFFRSEDGQARLESAIRAADTKRNQCQARIELSKKSVVLSGTASSVDVVEEIVKLDVLIAGARIALAEPVKVSRMVTWAVINDEMYREGDIVSREGVKIIKIHRHAVEIEYKGEVRQVGLKK
jgi:hypothetical protein